MDYTIEYLDGYACEAYNDDNDIPEEEWISEGWYIVNYGVPLGPFNTQEQAQKKAQQIFG